MNSAFCLTDASLPSYPLINTNRWVVSMVIFVRSWSEVGVPTPPIFVPIDRQSVNVYHTSSDTLVRFSFFANAQCERVAQRTCRASKTTNAVTRSHRGKVDKVYQCVYLIESFTLQYTPYKCFRCRTIARRVFATGTVNTASGSNARYVFQCFSGKFGFEFRFKRVYFRPKAVGCTASFSLWLQRKHLRNWDKRFLFRCLLLFPYLLYKLLIGCCPL